MKQHVNWERGWEWGVLKYTLNKSVDVDYSKTLRRRRMMNRILLILPMRTLAQNRGFRIGKHLAASVNQNVTNIPGKKLEERLPCLAFKLKHGNRAKRIC